MRILLVVHGLPPESTGGSEITALGLAHALAETHEVAVLHRVQDPAREDLSVNETSRGRVRVFSLNHRHPEALGFESYRDPRVASLAAAILDSWRPDVVHVHHLTGLSTGIVFEARRRRVPVVVTLHDFWTLCPLGQLLNVRLEVCPGPSPTRCLGCVGGQVAAAPPGLRVASRNLPFAGVAGRLVARVTGSGASRVTARLDEMRELLRAADVRISPSRFLRDRMAALGVDDIEVVPNGHEPFAPIPRRPEDGRVRFGFLGSVIPSKGVHILAEAFLRLDDPRAELRIHGPAVAYHGDDGYLGRLQRTLAAHPGAFRGSFPHEGRAAVLGELDVVVVPSLWEENAPLTVHEAFLARRPVVVSGHGGLAELVRDGVDGLWFRPGDAGDLARVLRRLLDDRELRGRLGTNPKEVPTLAAHASALESVYGRAQRGFAARAGRVGVVIVDHGRPEDTAAAAASVLDDDGLAPVVVVVENGPSGGPRSDRVEVVRLGENRGYAAGVNAGVAHLRGRGCDRWLLLNNDATLTRGSLRRLAEALDDDRLAAVAPAILRAADGRLESLGARFDLRSGRYRLVSHGEPAPIGEGRLDVESLAGAAMMVRADAFDRVGPFEEDYFHYFEESDWCVRARRAGLGLAVVLGARAIHAGGRTLGAGSSDRLYYAARNHLRAVERLLVIPGAFRWLRRASVLALNLAHAVRQKDVSAATGVRAVLHGTSDFLRGRSGPLRRAS